MAKIKQIAGLQEELNALFKVDGTRALTGNLNVGNNKVTNVAAGTESADAINKGQLDSAVSTINTSITSVSDDLNTLEGATYNKTEVDQMVAGQGKYVAVVDKATMDTNLANGDYTEGTRVYVEDDGDGKWAVYTIVDNSGTLETRKISDPDLVSEAISGKVSLITVTGAIDLDQLKTDVAAIAADYATEDFVTGKTGDLSTLSTTEKGTLVGAINEVKGLADTAKTTADQAIVDAAAAQTTANSALSTANTANGKADTNASAISQLQSDLADYELDFTETTEEFDTISTAVNTPVEVTLSNPRRSGFVHSVFINGVRLSTVETPTPSADNKVKILIADYAIETDDKISVLYTY